MSKIESAMRVVLDFKEAFNRHDVAGMMQLMSEDAVFEYFSPPPDGVVYTGKEAITQFWQDFFHEAPQALGGCGRGRWTPARGGYIPCEGWCHPGGVHLRQGLIKGSTDLTYIRCKLKIRKFGILSRCWVRNT
jgi:hypothetical protein